MKVDISVVLYRPRWDELKVAVSHLAKCSDEIKTVHFLLSGGQAEYDQLRAMMFEFGSPLSYAIHHRFDNLGFAGGHNFLMSKIFSKGAENVLLFNPDLMIEPGALTEFISSIGRHSDSANGLYLYGPTLKSNSNPERQIVDSAGIFWTSSGRHLDLDQGCPWKRYENYRVVDGLTGACLLVPRDTFDYLVSVVGDFFDPAFVAFREDAELGITARRLGVLSICVMQEGFVHNRGNPGTTRKNRLVNMLGVQNRFLIRWRLGSSRPGNRAIAGVRDLVVVVASLTVERSSLPGIRFAYAIRRWEKSVCRRIENLRLPQFQDVI
ncbi:glycosyltransferase family 2 protein [Rhodococcoides fascians]|uniref:Glycosyltransferase 2-like domain-containing protein n=1 Tax=Rhodococcoides fascians TaxID=1828 RepID=A0A143QKI3_RHOFA|nr:glycosyltransferase family 2 protein [Rhodococcus fascians]AMY23429.1 hypothetical protein A3Q41_02127 [Rhodococcus fascians]